MLCQKCHEKTAAVFISSIVNGKETRMYLCNDCAKDYPIFNFSTDEPFSIKEIMEKFKEDEILAENKENLKSDINNEEIVCSACNTTYNEYRETGKLGCGNCYKVFENQLKLLLNTMYSYTGYIGKIPKSNDNHIYVNNEIKILREDLNLAVEKEEYEKAADIRDKIRELESCKE